MYKKGESDEDFKGRKVDHDDKSIPDKMVHHYGPDERGKTADENRSKPKKKKANAPKP